jgi:hypothetical protein
MIKNNIPVLLANRKWTRYKLWKALDIVGARDTVYRLGHPEAINAPIPPRTQWGTLRRIADVLGVTMNELEKNEDNDQL